MKWLLNQIETVTPYAWEVALFGILFIVLMSFFQRKKIHASDIASFATTTGIFFTFLGIVIALGGLGTLDGQADVQKKINVLLSGIFVAFIPSIAGAAIAVWTHIHPKFWCKPIEDDPEKEETDIDAKILQEIRKLNKNLVGDGETSLTTRLEKFQLKVTENQDALRQEFQDFSKNVAENIIEALKKSMASLNEKLGEQFGENFKRFADVIPKLLDWQEHYRETIENTQQQLKSQSDHLNQLLGSLGQTQQAFTKIAEHAEGIVGFSNSIDQSMQSIATSFTQSADSMAKMSIDADKFQSNVESLTAHIEKQTDLITEQMASFEQSAKSLAALANKANILDETAQQLNKLVSEMDNAISAMTSGLGSVERLSDTLQGKAESIDKNMKELTEKTVEELAKNLRGISEALVKDYQSVHEAIKQIKKQHDGSS